MDISNVVWGISLGTICTILSVIIGFLGYRLNKQKKEADEARQKKLDADTKLQAAVEAQKKEDERQKDIDIKLVEMGKDLAYIRAKLDESVDAQKDHEKRIQALEKACLKKKGGK